MANTKTISVILAVDLEMLAMATAKVENRSRNFILNRWIRNGMGLEGGGKIREVGDTGIGAQDKKNRDGVGYVGEAQFRKDIEPLVDEVLNGAGVVANIERRLGRALTAEDMVGVTLTKAEVYAMVPDPVFAPAGKNSDFPGMDAAAYGEGAGTDFQPDPEISQNEKQQKRKAQDLKKIAKVAARSTPPGAAPDFRSAPHDPKTCAVYGCLMCQAAKEE